jgi:tetratricopeptide (TPR) repeat protein
MKIEKFAGQNWVFLIVLLTFNLPIFAQNKAQNDTESLARAWFDEAMLETDNVRKIEDYDNALRLNPSFADAYNNRGVAKKHLKRFSEAIEDYDRAILLKPDFAVAYFNRGDAKKALGQYDGAIKDFDKTIELRPDLPHSYGNKGCTLVAQGKFKESLKWLNRCLEMDENARFAKDCRKEAVANYKKK